MEPINHEELIHRYLDGTLEENSHEALFQQLATNAQYRDELTAQVSLHRAAQEWSRQNEISPEVTRKLFGSLGFTTQSLENTVTPIGQAVSRSVSRDILRFLVVAVSASLLTFGLMRSGLWPGEAPSPAGNLRRPSSGFGISSSIPSVPAASIADDAGSHIPNRDESHKAILKGTSNNLDSRFRGNERWNNHGAKRIKTTYFGHSRESGNPGFGVFRGALKLANHKPDRGSMGTKDVIEPEQTFQAIEPREPTVYAIPNESPIAAHLSRRPLHFPDPPLDYSGFVVSVAYEQSSIPADPAHPEFAARNTNDLNAQVGYRFDRFEEAGTGYSRHVYRHIYSTTKAIYVTGKGYIHLTTWHSSDDAISLPGLYYTFHANNIEFLSIEPFASFFASKPSAGFLWRASAGLEWNAWDNLNAVISYSREQLNSVAYVTPQNTHNFFNFGISYQWLP